MIKLHAISYFIRVPSHLHSTHEMNESREVNRWNQMKQVVQDILLNTKKIKGKLVTNELLNSHLRFRYIFFWTHFKGAQYHFLQVEVRLPY